MNKYFKCAAISSCYFKLLINKTRQKKSIGFNVNKLGNIKNIYIYKYTTKCHLPSIKRNYFTYCYFIHQ